MISCKKMCLAANCEKKPAFYVNQSRFHGFCDYHFTSTTMEIEYIQCKNCENNINLTKNLIAANIKEYKESLREYFKQNEATTHKCSDPACESVNTTQLCSSHFVCDQHRIIFDENSYCQFCVCFICNNVGAYSKSCGSKVCINCKNCSPCCFVCCKFPCTFQDPSCKHFFCEEHFNSSMMCFCSPCWNCQKAQVRVRNCGHRCCENCEIKNYCFYCVSDNCMNCNEYKPLYQFDCKLHKFCENCYPTDFKCIKCSPCTRCNGKVPYYSSSCNIHPLCNLCTQTLGSQSCTYCVDYSKYSCHGCNKTYSNLYQMPDCKHELCEQCSKLECSHLICSLCIPFRDFCISCKPKNYCKRCKTRDPINEISCEHGLCKNCGVLENDNHYICWTCGSAEYFNNQKCTKCDFSLCDFCKEFKIIYDFGCKHKICVTCKKRLDISPQEEISAKNCIFCEQNADLYACSFCILYFKNLETLSCQHKCCEKCILINKVNCELCCKCDICERVERKYSLFCQHNICENCIKKQKNDECPLCQKVNLKIIKKLKCIFCNFLYDCFSENHKISSVCDNHNLCSACLKKNENFTSCGICNPCIVCRDPFCYSRSQKIKKEGQIVCLRVYNIHKGYNECIHCKNEMNSSSGILCQNCKDNKIYSEDFTHTVCTGCTNNIDCLNFSKDSRFYCVNCIFFKRFPIKCKSGGNHYCSKLLLCDHGYCPDCDRKGICKDCISLRSKDSKKISIDESGETKSMCEERTVEKCKNCNKNNSTQTYCDCKCKFCDLKIGVKLLSCGHKVCKVHSCKSECQACFNKNRLSRRVDNTLG